MKNIIIMNLIVFLFSIFYILYNSFGAVSVPIVLQYLLMTC